MNNKQMIFDNLRDSNGDPITVDIPDGFQLVEEDLKTNI